MKKQPSKQPQKQNKGGKNKKAHYKVRNWRAYNQALVDRGNVIFWVSEEALKKWEEQHKTGKRGKPRIYSNIAIRLAPK